MDYKHHPTDVIAGGLIGTIIQILNCFGATLIFSEDKEKTALKTSKESIPLQTQNENDSVSPTRTGALTNQGRGRGRSGQS